MSTETTYRGQNMSEVLLKVKMDLGEEAVIEKKRQIKKGGILGLFQESLVEVDAKLPETTTSLKKNGSINSNNLNQNKTGNKTWELNEPVTPDFSARKHAARLIDQKKSSENNNTYSRPRPKNNRKNDNFTQLPPNHNQPGDQTGKKTSEKLTRVLENTDLLSEKVDELAEQLDNSKQQEQVCGLPGQLDKIYQSLELNGVKEEYIRDIIGRIRKETAPENIDDPDHLFQQLENIVRDDFKKTEPLNTVDNEPLLVPFVGPTGVGKTTSLAKLAAYFFSMEQKSVGFITMDHYRLMAVEQLASYADILQVPLIDVSEESGDFSDAVEKMKNQQVDMIFIDTAGRSQFDENKINHLQTLRNTDYRLITHLVVSATSRHKDIISILDGFSPVDYERLVVTKLDETNNHGLLYNLLRETEYPVSYLADGQGVPDDLEMAEPDRIAELIAEVK